ncbi:fumarylacetoacetate hydrolase family protein [Salinarchaeum sp. IM2453]|uniref:fumarylacetoacetate hydrolase family protein n=1 Tax=Salinarchaeum sp. IM2453 TaxID=2862870 RepID=UPI001C82F6A8|nr:fumarylacetoacetate hydrolase family protein [Salinarchaeum sp. IM2453]QZA88863.1 fumarylacetoacetate hydrolase family protein [Salinarchaeum sp. IM2453]
MKQIRFRDPAGAVRTGQWEEGVIKFGDSTYSPDDIDILPPCEPTKIVCVGKNYAAHADELDSEVPDRPLLFLKPPNTVAGHTDTIQLPEGKERVDYEAELAVVIGSQCRNVDPKDAKEVIAGYTCGVDLSNRDDQWEEQNWIRGKAFDGAAPLGPVLASPDELPDDAQVQLWVNDEQRQDASIEQLYFSIEDLIAEITEYMTLEPGDVIMTGTPEGVGPLSDGDEVRVQVEGVGELRHTVKR